MEVGGLWAAFRLWRPARRWRCPTQVVRQCEPCLRTFMMPGRGSESAGYTVVFRGGIRVEDVWSWSCPSIWDEKDGVAFLGRRMFPVIIQYQDGFQRSWRKALKRCMPFHHIASIPNFLKRSHYFPAILLTRRKAKQMVPKCIGLVLWSFFFLKALALLNNLNARSYTMHFSALCCCALLLPLGAITPQIRSTVLGLTLASWWHCYGGCLEVQQR